MASEGLQIRNDDVADNATAFLVDLVSNRKIPITSPRCKVGRDDLNDIVISGDQSISRFHFVITKENGQYMVQDGKSRHGTFLNGNQITIPEPIHDGDVLKVGVSLFWFVIEAGVNVGSDKFAPVDIELIDQQELEFMDAVPPMDEPARVEAGATQEVSKLDEAKVEAAIAEKKKFSGPAETTAAIPTLPDDILASLEAASLAERSEAPAEEPATARAEADTSEAQKASESPAASTPEPAAADAIAPEAAAEQAETPEAKAEPATAESAAESAKEQSGGEITEDDDEITVAMLLDPLHKETARKAKDSKAKNPNDPQNTLVNLNAVKGTKKDQAEVEQQGEVKGEGSAEPSISNFTDFSSEHLGSIDYQFSAHDALSKPPESTAVPESALNTESEPEKNRESTPEQPAETTSSSNGSDDLQVMEKDTQEPVASTEQMHGEAPATLGKFAEIIGEASSPTEKKPEETSLKSVLNFQSEKTEEPATKEDSAKSQGEAQTTNGAKGMSIVKEGASTVPDWCKRYFGTELNQLSKELGELNEQVRLAQQKIKDVEGRVALTKGLRNTLLTAQGEELVEACGKVLTMLGWKVKVSDEDKHELRLETSDEKGISIARIVWTETQADRTHLGQLSISQTRFWCEAGVEPKGILVVSKGGEAAPTLSQTDRDSELADYASKKNVCLMTTLQLLSVYKEIALGDGKADTVRDVILNSSGWLSGYNLEPGSEHIEKEDNPPSGGTNKLSSLLSA